MSLLEIPRRYLSLVRGRPRPAAARVVGSSMRFPMGRGNLAIEPKALDVSWSFEGPPQAEPEMFGDIAMVHIRGPMTHHCEWWFESYDAIVERMRTAFYADSSRCVLVEGDTPGGDVSGLFDTAAEFDRLQEETGKLLYWYVDGQTCSAGVALSTTSRGGIYIPPEGVYGSIGVIAEIQNMKRAAEAQGVDTYLVTSGECKADGHPMAEVTEEMLARIQEGVDFEANIFWNWVADHRGVSVEAVQALQAGLVRGQQAIDAGLCDEIATFSGALQMVAGAELTDAPHGAMGETDMAGQNASGKPVATTQARGNSASKKSLDDARKMLGELAAEDSDEGRRARKMLDSADEKEPDGDEPKDHEEPDGDEGESEDGGDDASASSATSAEDDGDDDEASSAESDDDATRAESEEGEAKKALASAKKCEDEASEEDAKARKALRANNSKAALVSMGRADSLRGRASSLRREARMHRSAAANAKSNASLRAELNSLKKSATRLNTPQASTAAIGARGANPSPKTAAKTETDDVSSMPPGWAKAFGFESQSSSFIELDGVTELGLPTPEEAAKVYTDTKAQVRKLGGRAQ